MTNPRTVVALLLDSSSSMRANRAFYEATLSGFNEYRQSLMQDTDPDNCYLGLWTFHIPGSLTCVYEPTKVADTPELTEDTYQANGPGTALYDAIVDVHNEIDKWVAIHGLQAGGSVDVVFVVYTDGQNNQGKTTRAEAMAKNDAAMKDKEWQVVYLGVGADDYAASAHVRQAAGVGTRRGSTMTAAQSAAGSARTWDTLRTSTQSYRSSRAMGQSVQDFLVTDVSDAKPDDEKDDDPQDS